MTPVQKSNPSILDLQVAITDVEQLMLTYQQEHETYVTNLKAGLHTKSAASLATLKILNKQIETKLIYIQTTSADIKTKNALYGNGITTADGELDTIIGEIQKKNIVLLLLFRTNIYTLGLLETFSTKNNIFNILDNLHL